MFVYLLFYLFDFFFGNLDKIYFIRIFFKRMCFVYNLLIGIEILVDVLNILFIWIYCEYKNKKWNINMNFDYVF